MNSEENAKRFSGTPDPTLSLPKPRSKWETLTSHSRGWQLCQSAKPSVFPGEQEVFLAFAETLLQWICDFQLSFSLIEGRPPGRRPSLSHAASRWKKEVLAVSTCVSKSHLWPVHLSKLKPSTSTSSFTPSRTADPRVSALGFPDFCNLAWSTKGPLTWFNDLHDRHSDTIVWVSSLLQPWIQNTERPMHTTSFCRSFLWFLCLR